MPSSISKNNHVYTLHGGFVTHGKREHCGICPTGQCQSSVENIPAPSAKL